MAAPRKKIAKLPEKSKMKDLPEKRSPAPRKKTAPATGSASTTAKSRKRSGR